MIRIQEIKINPPLIFILEKLKIINMANNSVTLHRVLKATPEKVYRAFTEPNAMSSWLPPYGFLCVVHQMDVTCGWQLQNVFY